EKRLKHINRIKSSVGHMTQTLEDFLSLGKLEEGMINISLSEFDIVELCNDVKEEMQATARLGQKISYEHSVERTIIHADKTLLRNVLVNLLSNAIKYSENSEEVKFSTAFSDEVLTI